MHVSIVGGVQAGKTTLALAIAALIAEVRKGAHVVGIATERTAGPQLAGQLTEVERVGSLRRASQVIASAAGGVAVLDTATRLYERALESYKDLANEWKRRSGTLPTAAMRPESWAIINRHYREALEVSADRHAVDLVTVHRQGQTMMMHPELGMVEGEGLRARGQSEAGSGADLLILVEGGLRSTRRRSGERAFAVISDLSASAVGCVREMPDLRSPKDAQALKRAVRDGLRESIRRIIDITDPERSLWAEVETDRDDFEEAREEAERREAKALADRVVALLARAGIVDARSAASKARRIEVLDAAFGVTEPDRLTDLPPAQLRAGIVTLDALLRAGGEEAAA